MHRNFRRPPFRGVAVPLLVAAAAVLAACVLLSAEDGAAAMSYRIAIPGLSAEPSTQLTTPSVGDVRVRNVGTAVVGSLTAFGEVQNDSNRTVTNVRLRATGVGADGAPLRTVTASALSTQIAAHATGLFAVPFTGVTEANARVTVTVEAFDVTDEPVAAQGVSVTVGGPHPLEVVSYDSKTHERIVTNSTTGSVLNGTVTNASTHALTSIDVLIAFYDGAGRVALIIHGGPVATAFPSPGPPKVAAGQSATFTAQLVNADYLGISGGVTTVGFANATIVS